MGEQASSARARAFALREARSHLARWEQRDAPAPPGQTSPCIQDFRRGHVLPGALLNVDVLAQFTCLDVSAAKFVVNREVVHDPQRQIGGRPEDVVVRCAGFWPAGKGIPSLWGKRAYLVAVCPPKVSIGLRGGRGPCATQGRRRRRPAACVTTGGPVTLGASGNGAGRLPPPCPRSGSGSA